MLGVRTLAELREAAEAGRLQEVPGIGPETERKLRAALAREVQAAAPKPLLLNRSRPLVESIAEALGGIAAGDPRRWRDASERLAVVVPGDRVGARPLRGLAADRGGRRARRQSRARRDRRGRAGRAGRRRAVTPRDGARSGHRLTRVGRCARAAARRARRGGRLRRARAPVRAARAARGRRAGHDRPRRGGRDPRRPPLPLDLVGREGDDPRDGPRRPRPRLRVPRDLRPHGQRRRRHRARRRRRAAAGRRDRRRQRGARAVPRPARNRVRYPAGRYARSSRRRAGRARLGAGKRPRRPARLA